MTHPFCTLRHPGIRENAREICGIWKDLQSRGYRLTYRTDRETSRSFLDLVEDTIFPN